MKVLVAEDNEAHQLVLVRMLSILGIGLLVVSKGNDAVNAFIKVGNFDLILMDCEMPEMDGYEATRIIRMIEQPKKRIPIVALTAHAFKEDIQRCLAAGMDDFLSKPFNLSAITALIKKWAPELLDKMK